ncbi:MAG TPA: hypothetical protein VIJ42_15370 [Stellaceae bacterium]
MMTRWRLAVIGGGLAVLALFALLYVLVPATYMAILTGWGIVPYRFPFLDTHAILSALQCAGRGIDPYRYNPCDVLSRAFVYSPAMLEASVLPVTPAWNAPVGILFALLYFIAVASLPPPRGAGGWAVMALALFSTMSVFALERGNVDLLMFALVVLAGHLARRGAIVRGLGYAVIVVAALLKYYPIVALIVALRERPRRMLSIAFWTGAILVLFVIHYRERLTEALALVPVGSYYTDFFGAKNLPFGLAGLLLPIAAWPGGRLVLTILPWLVLAALLWGVGVIAITGLGSRAVVAKLPEPERLFLLMGAALIVGCFLAGQNIGYRGIDFLLLLPGLMALARLPKDGRRFFVTVALIIFLMWGELFDEMFLHLQLADSSLAPAAKFAGLTFWLLRELVWWRVIGTLAGLLLCFVVETPLAQFPWPRRAARRRVAR